jgi:hypothetical protein
LDVVFLWFGCGGLGGSCGLRMALVLRVVDFAGFWDLFSAGKNKQRQRQRQ